MLRVVKSRRLQWIDLGNLLENDYLERRIEGSILLKLVLELVVKAHPVSTREYHHVMISSSVRLTTYCHLLPRLRLPTVGLVVICFKLESTDFLNWKAQTEIAKKISSNLRVGNFLYLFWNNVSFPQLCIFYFVVLKMAL